MNGYPILQDVGTLGFAREQDYSRAILAADFGGGYFATATVDDPEGEIRFSMTWRDVHRDAALITVDDGSQVSRTRHIKDFFAERMALGNAPFIIEDVVDGTSDRISWLCQFTSLKLKMSQGSRPWLYNFALECRGVRLPDGVAIDHVEGQGDVI